jgi:hypothetical protein
MSSTSVMAAVGPAISTPQGPVIHVSNFRTYSSDTTRGPAVNAFLSIDSGRSWTSSSGTSREPSVDCRVKSSR